MSRSREKAQEFVFGAIGIGLFLALWQIIGVYRLAGLTWPPLTQVLAFLFAPSRQALFLRAAGATFSMAALGYLSGGLAGIVIAAIVHVFPILRPGTDRLSGTIHAIPAIALAPIFIVLINRDFTGMAIAALNVYFVLYIGTTSGLMNATQSHRDLFSVLGASKLMHLLRLDLPAAIPAIVSAMKYAVPASFIGAILGEWFGASRGLGLLMVSAMQNFQIALLWSAVLIAAGASLVAFGAMTLLERLVYRRFQ